MPDANLPLSKSIYPVFRTGGIVYRFSDSICLVISRARAVSGEKYLVAALK